MSINTAGGVRLFLGTSAIALVQADFEAESWIEIGEVEDAGEVGDESELVTFAALKDGRVRKLKSTRDAGTQAIVVGDDVSDEGQQALDAAEATPYDYNIKIQLNDAPTLSGTPTILYYRAKIASRRRNIGNVSNVVRKAYNLAINSAIIEVPAAE